ncbi:recombinase RecT [Corynebacterium lubricantis]|uniref:recombinase RecT n=1 Tax=Corynebacterium lubricantis TaxID=541095 RepID=UPI00037B95B2|nr:recombinase RecT [Corynebacterium lubricantis]
MTKIQQTNNPQVEQSRFTPDQLTTIEQMGYKHIPENHLRVFFARAQSMGLNPNNPSQIALIERGGKNGATYTLQVGIAGLRNGARRISDAKGSTYSESDWKYQGLDNQGKPTGWTDYWPKSWGQPEAARVTVTRDGQEFSHVVYWDESVQTFGKSGDPTPMWAGKPLFMLGKNAAAGAFRKAFPDEMSDVYLDSERFDSDEPVKMTAKRTDHNERANAEVKAAIAKQKQAQQEVKVDPLDGFLERIVNGRDRDEIGLILMEVAQQYEPDQTIPAAGEGTPEMERARDAANSRMNELKEQEA